MENWIDNHLMPACLAACLPATFFCILSLYSDATQNVLLYYYDNYYTSTSVVQVIIMHINAFKTEKTENMESLLLSTLFYL